MYSQKEVDNYMLKKYGPVDYHIIRNRYIHIDDDDPIYEPDGTPKLQQEYY